jgi:integrase
MYPCGTCKAEGTIIEAPNRTSRDSGTTLKNVGFNGACLREILAGFAGEFRTKTAHRLTRCLPDTIRCAPATSRIPRTRGRQLKGGLSPEYGARRYVSPPGDWWLVSLQARKRRRLKPATISGWRDALNAWLLPNLGGKLRADVSNKAVRDLVGKMSTAGLSAKTIVNYVQVVKLVVASAVNDEGEQIYPRTWNHDFIQLPMVRKDKQYRPTVTDVELGAILSSTKKRKHVMLFSLLAATGLRVREALALRSTDFGPDCRVLHVRRSVWRGNEQEPKTSNAVRVVDIPEVFASKLREYVGSINGLVFATADGKPLQQRNVLRVLHRAKHVGFHAFRRFRLTWLRKNGVPKDLERYWMGHAPEEVGDLYSKLKDDVSFRQEWAERAGLGFALVHVGTQNAGAIQIVRVA